MADYRAFIRSRTESGGKEQKDTKPLPRGALSHLVPCRKDPCPAFSLQKVGRYVYIDIANDVFNFIFIKIIG